MIPDNEIKAEFKTDLVILWEKVLQRTQTSIKDSENELIVSKRIEQMAQRELEIAKKLQNKLT